MANLDSGQSPTPRSRRKQEPWSMPILIAVMTTMMAIQTAYAGE